MTRGIRPAWGAPVARAVVARTPQDFDVTEEMGFEPDGRGQHVWLWVEKRAENTADVARALGRCAGVGAAAVGFSGRKDRWAVARQWFSVDLAGREEPDWSIAASGDWTVLASARHGRKLRPGTHRANRFRLRLSDVEGDTDAIEHRLATIRRDGFPNAFGGQRFGRSWANLIRARRDLERASPRRPPAMAMSAARAWLFNRALDQRIGTATWNRALPGEALMLAGTRSVFCYDGSDPGIPARVERFDLHPTGPLWGCATQPLTPEFADQERTWLGDEAALCRGLEQVGATAARRPLRLRPQTLEWHWQGHDLRLDLTLASGSFATAVLDEIVERVYE